MYNKTKYRTFPNKGTWRGGKTLGALSLERGHLHLLAETWLKRPETQQAWGQEGDDFMGVASLLANLRYFRLH